MFDKMTPKSKKGGMKTVECFVCGNDIPGENINDVVRHIQQKHLKTSGSGALTLKCAQLHCRKLFVLENESVSEIKSKALEMVDHQVRTHRQGKPAYLAVNSCRICRFWTYLNEALIDHMKSKHKSLEVSDPVSRDNAGIESRQSEDNRFSKSTTESIVNLDGSAKKRTKFSSDRKRKIDPGTDLRTADKKTKNGGKQITDGLTDSLTTDGLDDDGVPVKLRCTNELECSKKPEIAETSSQSSEGVSQTNTIATDHADDCGKSILEIDCVTKTLDSNPDSETLHKTLKEVVSQPNDEQIISSMEIRNLQVFAESSSSCSTSKSVQKDATSSTIPEMVCTEGLTELESVQKDETSSNTLETNTAEVHEENPHLGEFEESPQSKEVPNTVTLSLENSSRSDSETDQSSTDTHEQSTSQTKQPRQSTLKVFQCFLCQPWVIYSSYFTLRLHFTEFHFKSDGKSLTLSCPQCSDVFLSKPRAEKHLIVSVAQHMHQTHQMAAPEFLLSGVVVCPECTVWTMDEVQMKTHMLVHAESDADTKQESYDCFLCQGTTANRFGPWADFRDHFVQDHVSVNSCIHYGMNCPHCEQFVSFENQQVTWSSLLALMAGHMIKEHHMTVPTFVTRYTCTKCNFSTLLRRSFTGHQVYHDRADKVSQGNKAVGTTYECFICHEIHYSWADLVTHFKVSHFFIQNKDVNLTCPDCGVSLTFLLKKCSPFGVYITRLVQHMIEAHKVIRPTFIKEFSCEDCGYVSVVQDNFRAHVKQHQKIKKECPHCFVKLSPSGLWRHLKICQALGYQERHLVCTLCNSNFTHEYYLRQHRAKVHSVESRYYCQQSGCDRSFYRKDGLVMHLFNDHQQNPNNKPLVKCEKCAFVTLYEYQLKDHVKKMHTVGHFPCAKCGKAFPKYYSYNKHVCQGKKSHQETNIAVPGNLFSKIKLQEDGECYRFFCKFCSYSTTYKVCLQVHLKTYHTPEWNKGKVVDPTTSSGDPVTPDPDNEVVVETVDLSDELEIETTEIVLSEIERSSLLRAASQEEKELTVLLVKTEEFSNKESQMYEILVSEGPENEDDAVKNEVFAK